MSFWEYIILLTLWQPFARSQVGCPYSRTVVPGDPKRYIEVVHNVPHERHCAPGTEFDQLTCECSLLSAIPWSAGDPAVSLLELGSRPSKSKHRTSSPAEFRYDPALANIGSQSDRSLTGVGLQNNLINLLAKKSVLLDLYPDKSSIGVNTKLNSVGSDQMAVKGPSTLDLFSDRFSRRPTNFEAKLTSPLLNQDLATITQFLKDRRKQRTILVPEGSTGSSYQTSLPFAESVKIKQEKESFLNPGLHRQKSFVTGHTEGVETKAIQTIPNADIYSASNTAILDMYTRSNTARRDIYPGSKTAGTNINSKSNGARRNINELRNTASNDKNMQNTASMDINNIKSTHSKNEAPNTVQITTDIEAKKAAILQKLMDKLSALQKQTADMNRGTLNGKISTGQNSLQSQASNANGNHQHFADGLKTESTRRTTPGTQSFQQPSPYSIMFSRVAAKEGASDAHEIMQDRITEMGGGALAVGSPVVGLNSEIRSQLSSTLLENHPMSFLL